jgi:hypothetical protein
MLAVLDLARAEALVSTPGSICQRRAAGVARKVGVTKLEPLYAAQGTHGIIMAIKWYRSINAHDNLKNGNLECLSRIPRISGFVEEGDIIRGEKQNNYISIRNKQFRDRNPLSVEFDNAEGLLILHRERSQRCHNL